MSENNSFCVLASREDGECVHNISMQSTESDSWWASSAGVISVQPQRMKCMRGQSTRFVWNSDKFTSNAPPRLRDIDSEEMVRAGQRCQFVFVRRSVSRLRKQSRYKASLSFTMLLTFVDSSKRVLAQLPLPPADMPTLRS